jgi:zinc transporter ZupT
VAIALDGVGIGLGFQARTIVGIAVAIAVIAHDFTDGLNTVNLLLLNRNKKKILVILLLDASTPIRGVLSTYAFHLSANGLTLYLGFFCRLIVAH